MDDSSRVPLGHRKPIRAITAAERARERDAAPGRLLRDEPIPRFQTRIGQSQPPELVIAMRIDAGLQQDQVRPERIQRGG